MVKNRPVASPHTTVAKPPMARTKQKTKRRYPQTWFLCCPPPVSSFGSSIDHGGYPKKLPRVKPSTGPTNMGFLTQIL